MADVTTEQLNEAVKGWVATNDAHEKAEKIIIKYASGRKVVLSIPAGRAASTAGQPQGMPRQAKASPKGETLTDAITITIMYAERRLLAREIATGVDELFPARWETKTILNECSRMAKKGGLLCHYPIDPDDGYGAGYGVQCWEKNGEQTTDSPDSQNG